MQRYPGNCTDFHWTAEILSDSVIKDPTLGARALNEGKLRVTRDKNVKTYALMIYDQKEQGRENTFESR